MKGGYTYFCYLKLSYHHEVHVNSHRYRGKRVGHKEIYIDDLITGGSQPRGNYPRRVIWDFLGVMECFLIQI